MRLGLGESECSVRHGQGQSDFSLEVSFRGVRCVGGGRVPVLIVQLHTVLLLPRHDGQLRGHGLEAVP